MLDYDGGMSILEQKVNSTDVKLIGVEHTSEFFDKYEPFYQNEVLKSDALVLEQPIGAEFWNYPFFDEISNIAHDMKKPIYQSDPGTSKNLSMDMTQTSLGIILSYSALFTMFIGAISFGAGLIPFGIGAYAWLGGMSGTAFRNRMLDGPVRDLKDDELAPGFTSDIIFYGMTDYRNIMISKGIEKICDKRPSIDNLACIHGDAHTKSIYNYLKRPGLRDRKRLLYRPFETCAKSNVREYMPTGNGWDLVNEF
ncbi:MAG: hypothetical protein KKA79_01055 [Nanoarchaeota archaeon]|nr:hypothetical protein [Nanoarchaeota archaeon]MCG2717922.1 hypothetical protein [Nanoarchaeota archaeon]